MGARAALAPEDAARRSCVIQSDRWRRIDELLAGALEREEPERSRWLAEECGSDAGLRSEVESMLLLGEKTEQFLAEPASAAALLRGEGSSRSHSIRDGSHPSGSIDGARLIPGDVVAGRYRIVGLLGRGGMAEVYRADDLKLGQPVALKFLSEQLSRSGEALARFHREVSLARQVSHRHVCRVYDIGEENGTHFLTMEYVSGESLASLLKRIGRLPRDKAIQTARQLCAALAAIHRAGILHRDLKPQNVMVDERGDVRIADFGIAALTEDAPGLEALHGTPAYMSPEHFSGRPLDERSDLYSLGLILYECFTGKRPFSVATLEEILQARRPGVHPAVPSTLVTDLEPAIDDVLLQCLEIDPALRPASALAAASALPGGDPVAEALAAGETPSPEMVAASPKRGTVRPFVALALVTWVAAAMVLGAFLAGKTSLHEAQPLDHPPEVLQQKAAEIAAMIAPSVAARDRAIEFTSDYAGLAWLEKHDDPRVRWEKKSLMALPLVRFGYRQSPAVLEPRGLWFVAPDDPAPLLPGMTWVTLDTSGRLLQYERLPDAADAPSGGEVDWRLLFERAGLSPAAFTSIAPRELPLGHSDVRVAWSGRHPRRPEIPLRIEAASLGGRPVSFHVVHPWEVEQAAPAGDQEGALLAVLLSLYFGAITLAVFLAWKNYRIGRGDRRGTLRLMLFVFGSRLLYWIVAAHHAGSAGEAERFVAGLQSALYWAALLGLLYLALEPFVRKRWPEWTISWSRLLAGKATDPLVGRDLLAGGVLGMGLVVTCYVHSILPLVLGSGGVPPSTHSTVLLQFGFFGFRGFLALLITQMSGSLLFSFIVVAVVLFFAMLTRHRGAALVITFAVLYLAFSMNFGARSLPQYLVSVIMPMIFIIALSRFGLLTLVTALFYMHLWPFYPATSSVTEWHALPYVLDVLLLLVIAMYALRIATAGEPMLRREFLE